MSEARRALIVANSEYADPNLRRLVASVRDAQALAQVLSAAGIGGFDVTPVLNQRHGVVDKAIETFFSSAKRTDLLLLYFSGHGIKDEDGQLYFATTDTEYARARLMRSTAVSAKFVNEEMRRSSSRRQVLLLDCCYSGAFAKGMVAKSGMTVDVGDHFDGKGHVILTASNAIQYSFEDRDLGPYSVFTQALVEGLATGQADLDCDGLVSVDELYSYVHDTVIRRRPQQTPTKLAFVEGRIIIAQSPVARPAEIPAELQQALDSGLAGVRAAAVRELGRLLQGGHRGLSLAAREALERMAADDSRMVADQAREALLGSPRSAAWVQPEASAKPAGASGGAEAPAPPADARVPASGAGEGRASRETASEGDQSPPGNWLGSPAEPRRSKGRTWLSAAVAVIVVASVVIAAMRLVGPDAEALFETAEQHERAGNRRGAYQFYGSAAEAGSARARYKLGQINADCDGLPARDFKEAAKWFELAADQDLPEAQFEYGKALAWGRGVTRSVEKAKQQWSKVPKDHRLWGQAQRLIAQMQETGPLPVRSPEPCGPADRVN